MLSLCQTSFITKNIAVDYTYHSTHIHKVSGGGGGGGGGHGLNEKSNYSSSEFVHLSRVRQFFKELFLTALHFLLFFVVFFFFWGGGGRRGEGGENTISVHH